MIKKLPHFLFILLSVIQFNIKAQNIDSLKNVLKTAKHDTTRCVVLTALAINVQDEEKENYNAQLKELCEDKLSSIDKNHQEYVFYQKHYAACLNSIGFMYRNRGDIAQALSYYYKGLKIQEEIGDKKGFAISLNKLGNVYEIQGDTAKALEYFLKGLKMQEEIGSKDGIATSLNGIGIMYLNAKNELKALDFFQQSLAIRREIGEKGGIALAINNIGAVYRQQNNYPLALEYFQQSMDIYKELGVKEGIARSYNNIGTIYLKQKQYPKALENFNKCMAICKEQGYPQNIMYTALNLFKTYRAIDNSKMALENYELYIQMRDSINNAETQKASAKQQLKYEYEKKAAADSVKVVEEKKVIAAQLDQEQTQRYALYGGLLLVALFGAFMFNRLRVSQKQKNIIEIKERQTQEQNVIISQQKSQIEERHREITDSINYAGRIQRSFMATKELLNAYLPEYFVLFKPKDIVSGDFYWAASVSNEESQVTSGGQATGSSNRFFYLCTGDSTGHGVPGAIMSLLNITSIEGAMKQGLKGPAAILNETRRSIIERLKKDGSSEGGKDGMDCSLCAFDFENRKLFVSAANNAVWVIRGTEVIEIKPDKMPVGKHDMDQIPFAQQELDLHKGDVIFTLTDGFSDQFGGPHGKKFKSKSLRELLLKNAHLPMSEIEKLLEDTFNNWAGSLEQIDDVTVIGIRI